MTYLAYGFVAVLVVLVSLLGWRQLDRRSDQVAWSALIAMNTDETALFHPDMIADLPEPAQRYFRFSIKPDTPLHNAVIIEMDGEIGLGTKDAPDYQPMQALQILAPPHGLVWKLNSGAISGSDGATPDASWTRFWLYNLVPVVRAGGVDHRRSAFGRVVAEAPFWTPASLLPSSFVEWQNLSKDSARAIVRYGSFVQSVDIYVDDDGAPQRVIIQRWSNENSDKTFRHQPFGGDLSEFREFEGYTLATRVDGGNHIGTTDYFPFYKAHVTGITFPASDEVNEGITSVK